MDVLDMRRKYRHPATGTYTRVSRTSNHKQMITAMNDIVAIATSEKVFLTRCDMLIDWLYKKNACAHSLCHGQCISITSNHLESSMLFIINITRNFFARNTYDQSYE